ncbi:autophagy- protein 2 [Apophysomyces ossiformis]|uniref:Autophagy-related protein 2 n=1 Tax=Apophysomyces ossiformis TaxID=679940 RepID=A0A8H7EMI0_9FUNG|nr:autophagy- protein 2 [Apophysomyces ossiformis]
MQGLHLTLRPTKNKPRPQKSEEDTPIMSSSLHFADDFLRTEMEPDQNQALHESIQQSFHQSEAASDVEGLRVLTQVIDKMLARIKIHVVDTVIRVIHTSDVPINGEQEAKGREYSLDLHIPSISYCDEALQSDSGQSNAAPISTIAESSILLPPVANETTKIITIAPPSLWIRSNDKPSLYSIPSPSETVLNNISEDDQDDLSQTEFYEAEEGVDSVFRNSVHSSYMSGSITPRPFHTSTSSPKPYESLIFTAIGKESWVRLKLRSSYPFAGSDDQGSTASNPPTLKQVDFVMKHIRTMISPQQTAFFIQFLEEIQENWANMAHKSKNDNKPAAPESLDELDQLLYGTMDKPSSPLSVMTSQSPTEKPQHTLSETSSTIPLQGRRTSNIGSSSLRESGPKPDIKIKVEISLVESFLLYNEHPIITCANESSHPCPEISHLKLKVEKITLRLQQFPAPQNKKKVTRPSSDRTRPFTPIQMRMDSPSSSSILSTLDIRISNLGLYECKRKQTQLMHNAKGPYNLYTPVLEFDDLIRFDYDHASEFPTMSHNTRKTLQRDGDKAKAIGIRIEKRQTQEINRFVSAISFDQDMTVELEAFKLNVDPLIADRLENYVYAFVALNRSKESPCDPEIPNDSDNSIGQKIYEDLERASREYQQRMNAKVHCSFIRVSLNAPNMSQASTRDNFNGQLHKDELSVDIRKAIISWKSDRKHESSEIYDRKNEPSPAHPMTPLYNMQSPGSVDPTTVNQTPTKLDVQVNFINVFLKSGKGLFVLSLVMQVFIAVGVDDIYRCWFTSKTSAAVDQFSSAIQSPSFEITIRPSGVPQRISSSSKHDTFGGGSDIPRNLFDVFGDGSEIPRNLFEFLNRNETFSGEQKLHAPMEDQAETALMFKQRTIETSRIVVNCHFPTTRMSLTKETWDTVQILQNDLILWQPKFLSRLSEDVDHGNQREAASVKEACMESSRQARDFDNQSSYSMKTSSILSQSREQLKKDVVSVPSLFALVAVISDALWDLHYPLQNEMQATYRLHLSDFRYFAVIKHAGLNENITTLDIDNLTLKDVSNENRDIPLLYKTIPRTLNAKRNTAMVSLFSRLTSDPDLNRQEKVSSIVVCNLCYRFNMDLSFIENLVQFQKTPDEFVFIDPPLQHIKVYAHVLDTSVDYTPLNIPSRGAIVVDDLQVITDILPDQPIIDIKTYIQSVDFFLCDDTREVDEKRALMALEQLNNKATDPQKYWTSLGLVRVLATRDLETHIKVKTKEDAPGPRFDIAVLNNRLVMEGCADSFQSMVNFFTYIANDGDRLITSDISTAEQPKSTKGKNVARRPSHVSFNIDKEDMLSSLDENAFKGKSTCLSGGERYDGLLKSELIEEYHSGSWQDGSSSTRSHEETEEYKLSVFLEDNEELDIIEDYYGVGKGSNTKNSVVDVDNAIASVRIRDFDIVWKLYDGYDWSYVRKMMDGRERTSQSDPQPSNSTSTQYGSLGRISRSSSVDTGVSGRSSLDPSYLAQSPTFSVSENSSSHGPAPSLEGYVFPDDGHYVSPTTSIRPVDLPISKDEQTRQQQQNPRSRRSRRSRTAAIEIRVDGVSVDFDFMPPAEQIGIHLAVAIKDLEVLDNIKTSSWKKFLGYMRPDASSAPRERGSAMVDVELTGIKALPEDATYEFRLKVKLLPIRLYVDQDALNFLVKYFTFEKLLLRSTPFANAAIPQRKAPSQTSEDTEDGSSLFFQHVEIYPIVLKVDYKPKYINYGNIKEGQLAELVNLFHLDGAEVALSHVRFTGIDGLTKLFEKLEQEWLPHIKNTQVPHMVSGVSPIRSIVNLSSGVADLILLPIQQYRKDGRIIKGLQKGTQSFARATAMETINLSARFASGTQVILEHADGFFSATPSSSTDAETVTLSAHGSREAEENEEEDGVVSTVSKFADQPNDLSQGFQYAYQSLSKNIGSAAQTIFAVPTDIKDRHEGTAARAVIKAVPVAVIKPMIGLTGAFQSILVGLRNTIDPAMRLQSEDIIAVDLIFPDMVHFYGPRPKHQHSTHPKRQKLRGKVRLITSRPTKLHLVEIKFKGWTHLHWRDPAKSPHALLVEKMQAYKTVRKTKDILLEDATVPAGVTDLGFQVTIPGYLCPSFKSESMEIQYSLSAKILPAGKFEKEVQVQKAVTIHKTLMPKDVSSGQVTGYIVPRRAMTGRRPNCIEWQFKVPKWVCLENTQGVLFEGILRGEQDTQIEKIEIDMIQEELYRQHDESEGKEREKGATTSTKRQLTLGGELPSTYLYPPLGTSILFSFPLRPVSSKEGKKQGLTYTLDSPFLVIRHFIRVLIHVKGMSVPICVGLPIQISRELKMAPSMVQDDLPSYQSIARDGERLPDYTRTMLDEEEEEAVEEEEGADDNEEEHDRDDADEEGVDITEGYARPSVRPPRRKRKEEAIVILERTLDDFMVKTNSAKRR